MVVMVFLEDQEGTNKYGRPRAFQAQLLPFSIQLHVDE